MVDRLAQSFRKPYSYIIKSSWLRDRIVSRFGAKFLPIDKKIRSEYLVVRYRYCFSITLPYFSIISLKSVLYSVQMEYYPIEGLYETRKWE